VKVEQLHLLKVGVFRQHHYTNATRLSLYSRLFLTEGQTSESWVSSKLSSLPEIENHGENLFGFFMIQSVHTVLTLGVNRVRRPGY